MFKFAILLVASYICSTSALPPCICARDFTPVCGSDGETYPNNCMLECAATNIQGLKLNHDGACEPQTPVCICTYEYKPVCGIDGTTYSNECTLGCEKAKNAILEKQYDGPCKTEAVSEIKVAELPPCTCTRNLAPVCGTDGVTYNNMCLLKCAAQNKNLDKKADGPCEAAVKVVEEAEEEEPKNSESEQQTAKNCVCFRNYRPVCGSDGKTYANPCVLNCASNDKPGLTEVRRGAC